VMTAEDILTTIIIAAFLASVVLALGRPLP
jgi:hypothetical protein